MKLMMPLPAKKMSKTSSSSRTTVIEHIVAGTAARQAFSPEAL